MLRLPFIALLLLLISMLPACDGQGPDEATVSARSLGDALFVTNTTQTRVYYFIVGRKASTLIRWAPQLNEDHSIAQGTTIRLTQEDIVGSKDEKEIFVHWWQAVEHEGQRRPGPIQSFIVQL